MEKRIVLPLILSLLPSLFCQRATAQVLPRTIDKITYIGNYPKDKKGNWTDRLQGVATDGQYWYFTQLTKLWKVPLGFDLRKSKTLRSGKAGVKMVKMPKVLADKGYDHFGDADCFDGFLFIPIEGKTEIIFPPITLKVASTPVIGIYRVSDLKFIGYQELPNETNSGWCAIHPITKYLYTSHNKIDRQRPIEAYQIDWAALKNNGRFRLTFKQNFPLYNLPSSWNGVVRTYLQGGDFSDDGKYLFLLNGRISETSSKRGISVYEVAKNSQGYFRFSSNQSRGFRYQFSPIVKSEEPEGLCFANLRKNSRIGFKGGQLHAILLNKELGDNGVYIKHYKIDYK